MTFKENKVDNMFIFVHFAGRLIWLQEDIIEKLSK